MTIDVRNTILRTQDRAVGIGYDIWQNAIVRLRDVDNIFSLKWVW